VPATLLQTKLHLPRARPSLVSRPRLLTRLDDHHPLILLSAPAGCGKTTLLAEWVAQARPRVAWLSLDDGETIQRVSGRTSSPHSRRSSPNWAKRR